MRGILLLSILNIKGSYSRNIDLPLEDDQDIPDTVQWWFGNGGCWRIKTFALDHDIHTYRIRGSSQTTLELAKNNNLKHYGDITRAQYEIYFADCTNRAEVEAEFAQIGLPPILEIAPGKFAFWKPDDAVYATKSKPAPKEPSND
jgi:hypothetical protein